MLELFYASQADIPAGYESLYTEQDGKFVLTGVKGMKTQADVNKINEALRKERNDHKQTKDTLGNVTSVLTTAGIELADLGTALDEYGVLKATGTGKGNNPAELEARIKAATAPLQRQLEAANKQISELGATNAQLTQAQRDRKVRDAITSAATEAGITTTSVIDDILMYSSQFEVDEDGTILNKDSSLEPTVWLTEMKDKRPHWFPANQGGGSNGNGNGRIGTDNPWSAKHWNLTAQAKLISTDRNKAEQMARAAGSSIGAVTPPKTA